MRERLGLCSVLGLAASQAGCGAREELGWLAGLSGKFALEGVKWGVGLGVVGLLLALGYYLLLRRTKSFRRPGWPVTAARWVCVIALVTVLPLGFGFVGVFEGLLRAAEHELSDGELAREYFPAVGSVGADLVGTAMLAGKLGPSKAEATALREAFRSGERTLPTEQLPALISAIDGGFVRDIAQDLKADAEERFAFLREGVGNQVLSWFVDGFGEALVRAALDNSLEERGLDKVFDHFGETIRRLPEAAGYDGEASSLSHPDLSRFLVEVTIADGVGRFVVKPFFRAQQVGGLVPILLVLVLPLVLPRGAAALSRWFSSEPSESAAQRDSAAQLDSAGGPEAAAGLDSEVAGDDG